MSSWYSTPVLVIAPPLMNSVVNPVLGGSAAARTRSLTFFWNTVTLSAARLCHIWMSTPPSVSVDVSGVMLGLPSVADSTEPSWPEYGPVGSEVYLKPYGG
jgi:hypothetical protein